MFIQFITFGLFGAATVFTYVPKDTEPLTIISAIVVFWIILFLIYRLFNILNFFKLHIKLKFSKKEEYLRQKDKKLKK